MSLTKQPRRLFVATLCLTALAAIAIAIIVMKERWLPYFRASAEVDAALGDSHAEHDHGHEGHSEAASIEVSDQGLKNIGYQPYEIVATEYHRTLKLPAIVVERPGRSQIHITAPLTGTVTKIHAVDGEAVGPEEPLFEMRLTHEELVASQRDFLKTIANLEIVNRELSRLRGLGEGVIAGKRILEQEYEQQKLNVTLMAEEQALLLHGLSDQQIDNIRQSQQLFRAVTVRAPAHTHSEEACQGPHLFTVQKLGVAKGEQVEVGRELAVLADHCELHVEAQAFEDDAGAIREAAQADRKVTAQLVSADGKDGVVDGLEVLYVADQIDPQSRALKIYLRLPNQVAMEKSRPNGKQFLEWLYKPGQRMQIHIPVETWQDQFVVPTTAVIDEGAEAYVYRQNGDHFDQVPVHVVYRDQDSLVIANDGALFPDDIIAGDGAYQMHLALKNKAGGGVDPHAGHNH